MLKPAQDSQKGFAFIVVLLVLAMMFVLAAVLLFQSSTARLVVANEHALKSGLLGDVYFDFDKYDLTADARERLEKNAEFMKEYSSFVFGLEGHCDERGTNEYNLALGERRAAAAKSYLESLGVDGSRIRTISYGEERPSCMEHEEACWGKNRRGAFMITGRSGS